MNRKPIGQVRGVVFVILMSIITLGIYLAYWTYRSFDEVNAHRGQGLGGGVVLLAALGIAILDVVAVASRPSVIDPWEPVLLSLILLILTVAFLLPSYIGSVALVHRPHVQGGGSSSGNHWMERVLVVGPLLRNFHLVSEESGRAQQILGGEDADGRRHRASACDPYDVAGDATFPRSNDGDRVRLPRNASITVVPPWATSRSSLRRS